MANPTLPPLRYPTNASIVAAKGTHTETIRGLITKGYTKGEILDAYVATRLPEVTAGTLLRINVVKNGAISTAPRPMGTKKEQDEAASLLRKHGNTHYKNADSEMSASAIQARLDKAAASVKANEQRLASAKARLEGAKATATARKAS